MVKGTQVRNLFFTSCLLHHSSVCLSIALLLKALWGGWQHTPMQVKNNEFMMKVQSIRPLKCMLTAHTFFISFTTSVSRAPLHAHFSNNLGDVFFIHFCCQNFCVCFLFVLTESHRVHFSWNLLIYSLPCFSPLFSFFHVHCCSPNDATRRSNNAENPQLYTGRQVKVKETKTRQNNTYKLLFTRLTFTLPVLVFLFLFSFFLHQTLLIFQCDSFRRRCRTL